MTVVPIEVTEEVIKTLLNYIPSENQEEALEKVREIMQSKNPIKHTF